MKSSISPGVAAVIIVLAVAVAAFFGYRALSPPSNDAGMNLGAKADFSKITPDQIETVKKNFEAARSSRKGAETSSQPAGQ